MLRSVVSPALSFLAVVALAAACGSSTNANQGGFSNPGSDASVTTGTTTGDDDSGAATLGDDDGTNVGDGGLISIDPDGGNSGVATGGLDGGCATGTFQTSRSPIYLQIVLDGSGSMGMEKKWPTAVTALKSIFQSMETTADNTVGVGLEVFADSIDTNVPQPVDDNSCLDCPLGGGYCTDTCVYPTKKDVALRAVDSTQLGKLNTRLGGMPENGTPTSQSLLGAYKYFSTFMPTSPLATGGKQVVVLITDGVPSDDPKLSLNAATSNAAKGIATFVVGVGPFSYDPMNYDPTFLGKLAVAGGTSTAGCNPTETKDVTKACYFQITPSSSTDYTQEFIDAINDIRGEVSSCQYKLNFADGGTPDLTKVNVIYTDGMGATHTLVQDATNGWTFDNATAPTEVDLHGTDCNAIKSDPNGKVDIVVGCATVTMPGPR